MSAIIYSDHVFIKVSFLCCKAVKGGQKSRIPISSSTKIITEKVLALELAVFEGTR